MAAFAGGVEKNYKRQFTIGIERTFTDIEELAAQCKFRNCTRTNEPRCAIQKALITGELQIDRWQSYQKRKAENDYVEDKESYMIAKGKREKEIAKLIENADQTVTEWRIFMEQKVIIRKEEQKDWAVVEKITRQAFYNLYVPGCVEHYLVHIMRKHEDFIPELDFVLELNGHVIGNIMYTKAKLINENGVEKDILTFGPVSILPTYQRMGYGKMIMEHSFQAAMQLGYDTIVIFGSPSNYVNRGFKSCKKYNVCIENWKYPAAMMVKELRPHVLDGHKWIYHDSPVMAISEDEAEHYDAILEPLEKKYLPSQDEFYIMSHSFVEE